MFRSSIISLIVVVFLTATATAAFAHAVYVSNINTWQSGSGKCMRVYKVEISHGTGGGYSLSTARALKEQWIPFGTIHCAELWSHGANFLRARNDLYRGTSICIQGGWTYNTTTTSFVGQERYWGNSPPCGIGSYETRGWAQVYFDDAWRGQQPVRSGFHSLPA